MELFLTIFLFGISIILILVSFGALISNEPSSGLLMLIVGVLLLTCAISRLNVNNEYPKIDLPEEHSQIKESDTLKGYYDSEGTLHIEFNNKRNQR